MRRLIAAAFFLAATSVSANDVPRALMPNVIDALREMPGHVIDLRRNAYDTKDTPWVVDGLRFGETLEGQYFNRHVTGATASTPLSLAKFEFLLQRSPHGLAVLELMSGIRTTYDARGRVISKGPFNDSELGLQPITVLFPIEQFLFGLRIERLGIGRLPNDDAPIIEIKAFNASGKLIDEVRYSLFSSASIAFVRCDFAVDVASVQIVTPSRLSIGLSEVALLKSEQETSELQKRLAKLPDSDPLAPRDCPSSLG